MLARMHEEKPVPWYVKSTNPDGSVNPILCDEHWQVVENFKDQTARGHLPITIEDAQGRKVAPAFFGIS